MQWETAVYLGIAASTVLVAHTGPSRTAIVGAWLLFLSCIYCNITWYEPSLHVASTRLPIAWSLSDAAGISYFSMITVLTPRPRAWKAYCAILAWLTLPVHVLRAFELISPWWYAMTLNIDFTATCYAAMTPALSARLLHKRRLTR